MDVALDVRGKLLDFVRHDPEVELLAKLEHERVETVVVRHPQDEVWVLLGSGRRRNRPVKVLVEIGDDVVHVEDEALVPVADQHDVRENHPVLLEPLDIIQRLNDDVGTGSPRLEVPVVLVLHDELQHPPVNLRVDEPVALERVRDGRIVEEERYLLVVDVLDFTLDLRFPHRCIDAFHSMDSFVLKAKSGVFAHTIRQILKMSSGLQYDFIQRKPIHSRTLVSKSRRWLRQMSEARLAPSSFPLCRQEPSCAPRGSCSSCCVRCRRTQDTPPL